MSTFNQEITSQKAFDTQAIVSNTTTVGDIMDTQGDEASDVLIKSGTITDGAYTLLLEHGDDPALSDAATVPANFLDAAISTMDFALTDDNVDKLIGYVGKLRFLRPSIVSTGVTTGGTFSGSVVFGRPRRV